VPNNTPPAGTYSSDADINGGELSSWDGSFTYDPTQTNQIAYTRNNPYTQFAAVANKSDGNAIVFTLIDNSVSPPKKVNFHLNQPGNQGGKVQYKGNANDNQDPAGGEEGWTATQN